MTPSRRVVTRMSFGGKSEITSDCEPSVIFRPDGAKSIVIEEIWATASPATIPSQSFDPTRDNRNFLPAAGETRFRVVTIEPTKSFDLSSHLHRAELVEYLVILRGRIQLVLPSGTSLVLNAGDYIVQEGTEHAWNNPFSEPCSIAVILIGAEPKFQKISTN